MAWAPDHEDIVLAHEQADLKLAGAAREHHGRHTKAGLVWLPCGD
jgi:hypothetical protein